MTLFMQDELPINAPNRRFIRTLIAQGVDFLLVGGIAVLFHGCREWWDVDDLDIMLEPSAENVQRFGESLTLHSLPTKGPLGGFARPDVHFACKGEYYLDVLTPPAGIDYGAMKRRSLSANIRSISVQIVSRDDLIELKRIAAERQLDARDKHVKDLRCLSGLAE